MMVVVVRTVVRDPLHVRTGVKEPLHVRIIVKAVLTHLCRMILRVLVPKEFACGGLSDCLGCLVFRW